MDTQEKKFFAPEIKTYDYDLSQRWRIEWYEPYRNGSVSRRIVKYGNINRGTTVDERLRIADEMIAGLDFNYVKPVKKNILQKTIDLNSGEWRLATTRCYRTILRSFMDFLGDKCPTKVTTEIVNNYILHLIDSGASKNKICKYREALHTLYKRAIAFKIHNENPVPNVRTKKLQSRSKHYFNDYQIQAFKKLDIPRQLWLGMQFLYYCYIRPKEQRFLKVGDINFAQSFIEIKGENSKNNKTERVIIPTQLMDQMHFLQSYEPDYFIFGKGGNPSEKTVSANWLNYNHHKLLKELNIRGNYSVYSWKHTGVVKAVKAGINIKDLQLQLRHHSLDQVNEYLKDLGIMDSKDILYKFPTL